MIAPTPGARRPGLSRKDLRRQGADLRIGTLLALSAGGLSCLVALAGFRRAYYLSILLPASMMVFLLLAWIIYLRDDMVLRRHPGTGAAGKDVAGREPSAADAQASGGAPASGSGGTVPAKESAHPFMRMAARWDEPPIPRAGGESGDEPAREFAGRESGRKGRDARNPPAQGSLRNALVWASIELVLATAALRIFWGVGSTYFR